MPIAAGPALSHPALPSRPLFWPWRCLVELPSDLSVSFLFHIFPCINHSADGYGSDSKNFRPYEMPFVLHSFWRNPHYFYVKVSTAWTYKYLYIFLSTYLQILHHRPFSVSTLLPVLKLTVTLSDIMVRISRVESFFTGFSSRANPRWCSLRPSP